MPKAKTPQEILKILVRADDALTAQYSRAPPKVKAQITRCTLAIEAVIKDIIRADIHRRTRALASLSQTLASSTAELNKIKAEVDRFKEAAAFAQSVLNTIGAVLKFI